MKIVLVLFSVLLCSLQVIDLKEVRNTYKVAAQDADKTEVFNNMLQHVTKDDKVELVAYKGAGIALKGRFSKRLQDKKTYFIQGVNLVEYAIRRAPGNIELRFIRLGIQENTPKLLKYKANISEDKNYILSHYKAVKSKDLKEHIKSYVLQSKEFTMEEKKLL